MKNKVPATVVTQKMKLGYPENPELKNLSKEILQESARKMRQSAMIKKSNHDVMIIIELE